MTDGPNLDDVMNTEETAVPNHREHGKMPAHYDDDALAKRTEQEREEVGLSDYDPDDVPDAAEDDPVE